MLLEVVEIAVTGTARVGHRRDARSERKIIGPDAVVARVGVDFAGAGVDMNVNVDQARRHIQTGCVHHFEGAGRIDVRRHRGNLAVANRDVANRAHLVLGVNDVTALQQQIVLGLGERAGTEQHQCQHNSQDAALAFGNDCLLHVVARSLYGRRRCGLRQHFLQAAAPR